jgi:hypothetical protein
MDDIGRALNMSVGMVLGAGAALVLSRYTGMGAGQIMFEVVATSVILTGWGVWEASRADEGVKP